MPVTSRLLNASPWEAAVDESRTFLSARLREHAFPRTGLMKWRLEIRALGSECLLHVGGSVGYEALGSGCWVSGFSRSAPPKNTPAVNGKASRIPLLVIMNHLIRRPVGSYSYHSYHLF